MELRRQVVRRDAAPSQLLVIVGEPLAYAVEKQAMRPAAALLGSPDSKAIAVGFVSGLAGTAAALGAGLWACAGMLLLVSAVWLVDSYLAQYADVEFTTRDFARLCAADTPSL
jgi:hypothetical protein